MFFFTMSKVKSFGMAMAFFWGGSVHHIDHREISYWRWDNLRGPIPLQTMVFPLLDEWIFRTWLQYFPVNWISFHRAPSRAPPMGTQECAKGGSKTWEFGWRESEDGCGYTGSYGHSSHLHSHFWEVLCWMSHSGYSLIKDHMRSRRTWDALTIRYYKGIVGDAVDGVRPFAGWLEYYIIW